MISSSCRGSSTYTNPAALRIDFLSFSKMDLIVFTKSQNSSGNTLIHVVGFRIPLDKPFKERLAIVVSVMPETNFLGQQYNLDQTVRNVLAAGCVGNNITVIDKVKGTLSGLPAYKIDNIVTVPKVLKK
jgi:hypothetical protein